MSRFASTLARWQRAHGRRGLPWQGTTDPYRVWLSEIMLQQTQVAAVVPYFERFLARFPDVGALARASEDEVLRLWAGLGYYARGRNLHRASQEIAFERKGKFPETAAKLEELPGVGRSTAAAIAAFCFGERAAILDGNVERVLARQFGLSEKPELWKKAESLLPRRDIEAYTQALMDLGAMVCTRRNPRCGDCPVRAGCVARKTDRIGEFPARKAKKALPRREATWYVYRRGSDVLMERRPGRGLWGGLWTFPEERLFPRAREVPLAPFEHGFTHFRLRVKPMLCEVGAKARAPAGRLWLDLETASASAVPTPVRALLGSLSASR